MRSGRAVALAFVLTLCAISVEASCYTCAITASGTPYCKSKESGGEECYSRMSPWFCEIWGSCGGYQPIDPVEKAERCDTKQRWLLAAVDVSRPAEPQVHMVLVAAQVKGERSAQ